MARSDNKRMKAFSKRLNEMRKETPAAVKKAEEDTAPKLSSVETPKQKIKADLGNVSFAEAFRSARKNNPGEPFTWRGKSYSTAMASEKKAAPKPAAKPAAKAEARPAPKAEAKANVATPAIRPPASLALASKGKGAPAPAQRKSYINLDRVRAEMAKPEKRSPLFAGEDKLKAAQERAAAKQRGYAKGGEVKKYNKGGATSPLGTQKEIIARGNRTPKEPIPKTGPKQERKPLKPAGMKGYAKGGSIDGCAKKGKTKASMVKMAKGGSVSSRADGCAKKGRTSTKHVAMRNGGSC